MLLIRVACSGCPEEAEIVVAALEDIDRLPCDCGYGYVVLSVSEAIPV
jgi:hypothetical protein